MSGSGARPLEARDPRRIGSFRLLGVLGSGGMGRVYLGVTPEDSKRAGRGAGHYAAVKQVLPALAEDTAFLGHFGHELDNLGKLPDGTSARLLASDRTHRPPWFATAYIPGITLSDAMRLHNDPLPADSLWRLLRDAAAGLRAVHAAGIVHRDLKPSNVMLTLDGVTLIDFGVARAADQSRLTKTGMVVGTPAYMAPEQAIANQTLTGAADVFALGSLLLYAANGRPPFGDGSGLDLLYRIVHEAPDFGRLPDNDPELAGLLRSCLAKEAADRPTTDELFALAADRVPAAVSSPWPPAVTDRITEREAFAAKPPPPEAEAPDSRGVADSTEGAGADAEPVQIARPGTGPDGAQPERRSRRRRVLLIALPVVVVVGGGLTFKLAPFEIPDADARPGASGPQTPGTPSASATGGGPTKSAKPSAEPSGSTKKPSASASKEAEGGGVAGGAAGEGADGSGGTGGATAPAGTAGGAGGSDGGAQTPVKPAPAGTRWIENAGNGRCLAASVNRFSGSATVTTTTCGDSSGNGTTMDFAWSYTSGSGGSFALRNKETGKCLEPQQFQGYAIKDCTGSSNQTWKIGATSGKGRTFTNVRLGACLGVTPYSALTTVTCNAQDSSQLWSDIAAS
ncbi:serine/threonine-protein kinase [Streptomyces sp. NBC_00385]|uniref:serine/threonine-protein kinase n=1 Tax=Streptomyces sp. NBC_00385 TaxID=2975733 RepID=UPI002DDC785D|nr:protein kinase [Streptomyces sp. NBC_00385]WRZ04787.1 serine/threonine protein kinase [Streptomyces sp. NBC_00385]